MPPKSPHQRANRSLSLHHKKPFIVALIATLCFWVVSVACLTCFISIILLGKSKGTPMTKLLIALLILSIILWFFAYLQRRRARCPLCKASPFLGTLSHTHPKAERVLFLGPQTTAILKALFTLRWRCMHCGTPFDLLKKTDRRL